MHPRRRSTGPKAAAPDADDARHSASSIDRRSLKARYNGRLRTALFGSTALVAVTLVIAAGPAAAQTAFEWTGGTNTDYGTASNWNPPGGAPPDNGTERAVFGDGGANTNVNIGAPIDVNGFTFNGAVTSYVISGAPVALSGTGAGVLNTSSVNHEINSALLGDGSVQQNGTGTLTLSGFGNTYSGGTTVNSGTLIVNSFDAILDTSRVTVNGGVFNVAFSESIGSLAGTGGNVLIDAGQTLFTGFDSTSTTYAGSITGDGSLDKQLGGTLTLTGTSNIAGLLNLCNCATGGITIDGGSFSADAVGIQASVLTVTNGGTLNQTALGPSFLITGGGTLLVTGAGSSVDVTGVMFVGGADPGFVSVEAGGLMTSRDAVFVSGGSASSVITVTGANSTWTVANGSVLLGTGGGSGVLTIANGGQVSFANPLDTLAIDAVSTLNLGNGGTAGTISVSQITFTHSTASIVANFTDTSVLAADIVGPGSVVKNGTGTLILTSDTNNWTGGTTVNNGTLQIGNGGGTGYISGDVALTTVNSVFAVNRAAGSSDITLNGNFTGAGSFVQNGGGVTVLTGNNTYTGATTINGGTLALQATGHISLSSGVTINNNGVFDISTYNNGLGPTIQSLAGGANATVALGSNRLFIANASGTFAGTLADGGLNPAVGGSLTLLGGTLNLTGNSTYTGPTAVNGGTLLINGSITSPVTVNPGGLLGGGGTLGPLTINGGTLAPGNSIGTITINGSLTFTGNSIYQVEFSPTESDRTNVIGVAALAGTVQALALPGSFRARSYTILNATGGVNGTFAGLTIGGTPLGFAVRNPRLAYDANNVFLLFDPGILSPQLPTSANANQRAVAAAIDRAVLAGFAPPLAFDALLNLSGPAAASALTQLSGEVATGMQQAGFKSLDMFLGVMLNPFLQGRGTNGAAGPALALAAEQQALPPDLALAYASVLKAPPAADSFARRWTVWGSAYGGTSSNSGNLTIGSNDTRTNAYGFAMGADYRLGPNTIVGAALGGGSTSWSLSNGLGTGNSDAFQAGLYGSHRFAGSAYVSAAVAYTWHDANTSRNLTSPAAGQLTADFRSNTFGGRIESGYRWATPFVGVTPYGAVQALNVQTPGYAETGLPGSAVFALMYGSRSVTSTTTELGFWFDHSALLNSSTAITLRARAAWGHDFNTDRQIGATFQTLPVAGFNVFGASPAEDFALVSGAVEFYMRNGWSFNLKGDSQLASQTRTYSGTGTVRYAW